MVVSEVFFEHSSKMLFIEDDHMIYTLSAIRSDDSFDVGRSVRKLDRTSTRPLACPCQKAALINSSGEPTAITD